MTPRDKSEEAFRRLYRLDLGDLCGPIPYSHADRYRGWKASEAHFTAVERERCVGLIRERADECGGRGDHVGDLVLDVMADELEKGDR